MNLGVIVDVLLKPWESVFDCDFAEKSALLIYLCSDFSD